MALLLMQLGAHPTEIAATMLQSCVDNGAFFLDFSRPLGKLRWCGAWNHTLGFTVSLIVPVVHQAERAGRRSVMVDRGDPYFKEVQRLWKERFPTARPGPCSAASDAQIAADFATQFPRDAAVQRDH